MQSSGAATFSYDEKGFLVSQSELLSGGIAPEHICFTNPQVIAQLQQAAQELGDPDLYPAPANEQSQDIVQFYNLIYEGKDKVADSIVTALKKRARAQRQLWTLTGGAAGQLLVRAAFAVMLKLNQRLNVAFTAACEEVELLSEEFPEFDPTTDTLYKVWLSACKMLNWL